MKLKKILTENKDKVKRKIIEYIIKNIEKFNQHLNEKLYFLINKYENNVNIKIAINTPPEINKAFDAFSIFYSF